VQNDPFIDQELLAGRKIGAILRYRRVTGASLLVAKAAVDQRELELGLPTRKAVPRTIKVWFVVLIVVAILVAAALAAVLVLLLNVGKALG
jgi:hypothetical protein